MVAEICHLNVVIYNSVCKVKWLTGILKFDDFIFHNITKWEVLVIEIFCLWERTAEIQANHWIFFDSAHSQNNTHDMNLKKIILIKTDRNNGLRCELSILISVPVHSSESIIRIGIFIDSVTDRNNGLRCELSILVSVPVHSSESIIRIGIFIDRCANICTEIQ